MTNGKWQVTNSRGSRVDGREPERMVECGRSMTDEVCVRNSARKKAQEAEKRRKMLQDGARCASPKHTRASPSEKKIIFFGRIYSDLVGFSRNRSDWVGLAE